jgi:DNA-binding response OmpR family regulator
MIGLHRLTVLVVDDNRHIRALVKEILGALGPLVEEADNGANALRLCQDRAYDLIIVDYEMPGMTGAHFTRAFRAQSRHGANTAVLLMTAHGDEQRVLAARRAGVDGVVSKPLAPQVLFTRIEAALRRRAQMARG